MNQETRTLISWWKVKAENEHDPFIKFFIFYMCLDAWMTSESQAERESGKLNWLINTDNDLKTYWEEVKPNKHFQSWLNGLRKQEKIENMHPRHRGKNVSLTDTNNFGQVMKFIYQIRCNLFHGGKSLVNTNDRNLVHWSGKILERWIEWTL